MIKTLGGRLFAVGCILVVLYLSVTGTPDASASPIVHGTTTSSTDAGYLVDSAPANGSATASFAVPKVSCTSRHSGMFIGVVIYTSANFSSSGIEINCKNGTASCFTAVDINGIFLARSLLLCPTTFMSKSPRLRRRRHGT